MPEVATDSHGSPKELFSLYPRNRWLLNLQRANSRIWLQWPPLASAENRVALTAANALPSQRALQSLSPLECYQPGRPARKDSRQVHLKQNQSAGSPLHTQPQFFRTLARAGYADAPRSPDNRTWTSPRRPNP